MTSTWIATAGRTARIAVLTAAFGMAVVLAAGSAHAAPGTPDAPRREGTLYGDRRRPPRSGATRGMTTTAWKWLSPTWSVS